MRRKKIFAYILRVTKAGAQTLNCLSFMSWLLVSLTNASFISDVLLLHKSLFRGSSLEAKFVFSMCSSSELLFWEINIGTLSRKKRNSLIVEKFLLILKYKYCSKLNTPIRATLLRMTKRRGEIIQPQKYVCFTAYLRMQEDHRGFFSPFQFIHVV